MDLKILIFETFRILELLLGKLQWNQSYIELTDKSKIAFHDLVLSVETYIFNKTR